MKFGTVVLVTRGSSGRSPGTPGCLRKVKGMYIGGWGNQRQVKLLEDDPHDTVGWSKAGHIGWWSCDAVNEMRDQNENDRNT